MKLILKPDYRRCSEEAARFVANQVLMKESSVLGLSTGETPRGMYQKLVEYHRAGLVDFSKITSFNLDEFLGIDPCRPGSFSSYMTSVFWRHIDLERAQRHIPSSLPADRQLECARYEELISQAGGLDLAVLGIGTNGHIGFNEPGTPWGTLTHVATLSAETRNREASRFQEGGVLPEQAITMGIKTIMHARGVLLVAIGREKSEVLAEALLGPPNPDIPASVLQLHAHLTLIADPSATQHFISR